MEKRIIKDKDIKRQYFMRIRNRVIKKLNKPIFDAVINFLDNELKEKTKNGFIGIYWPLKGEVDLRLLRNQGDQRFALPASHKDGSLTYHLWGEGHLQKDFHGIPAPLDNIALHPENLTLLLVPALSIDLKGTRLGYGGGFYDRLRNDPLWKNIPALAIIPSACISIKPLPCNDWDVPFDGWINENGFFRSSNLKHSTSYTI